MRIVYSSFHHMSRAATAGLAREARQKTLQPGTGFLKVKKAEPVGWIL